MRFNRFDADAEFVRHGLVHLACDDAPHDLALARRQPVERGGDRRFLRMLAPASGLEPQQAHDGRQQRVRTHGLFKKIGGAIGMDGYISLKFNILIAFPDYKLKKIE